MARLPTTPWLIAAGQRPTDPAPMMELLERKLAVESTTGVRAHIGPTLQVPVPKWSSGTAHGYSKGVDPSVLFNPTAWLDREAREAAAAPETAAALGEWLVNSGWYDQSSGEWLSPGHAMTTAGISAERAARWLNGEDDQILDDIQAAVPHPTATLFTETKDAYGRITLAATATATHELIESVDVALIFPEDASAQSHLLAAELLQLPAQIPAPDEFGEPVPVSVIIPSIGIALANREVEADSALAMLRLCLDGAINWLGSPRRQ